MTDSFNNSSQDHLGADEDAINFGQIFSVLWRAKFLILGVALIFGLIGGFYAYKVAVPKFRATAVLLLEPTGQQIVDLSSVIPSLGSDFEAINTEVEVLKSRRLMKRVVIAENLIEDPEFNPSLRPPSFRALLKQRISGKMPVERTDEAKMTSAIDALLNRMSVRNVSGTYVLQVTVETETASMSARLADRIASEYILYQMDEKFEATRDASEWLTSRVSDLKVELEHAEALVSNFSSNSEVVSADSVRALDRQVKEARDRLETTITSKEAADESLAKLKSLMDAPAAEKNEQADDTRLSSIFNDVGEGSAFDARFAQLVDRAQLLSDRTGAQVQSLTQSIQTLEDQIATQSDELFQLQQLTREADASRLLYEYFLGRLKETSAQEGIQQPDGRVLSNAVVPRAASEPRKSRITAMALIVGVVLGSGLALLLESRISSYRDPLDLERDTNLPIMGQIPKLPTTNRRKNLDYLASKPTSAAAESVRNLRTSLLLSGSPKGSQVIMSTSALPAEGKTTISFALAQNLVGLGKKVLLVEGDIRRLVFSEYVTSENSKGLMSVLRDEVSLEDAVLRDEILGADILISEPSKDNAADVLSSNRFKDFLDTAREAYDYVIVDTPPVLIVPDARIVAQLVDVVIFTVRWDHTSKLQVRDALRMFETVDIKVDGLVLNQINPKGMERYGYGGGYGAYAAYGSKYYNN